MSQSKKNNILVGDIGNTETKIFFRNNKIEKKIALKSNEMIYSKIKSKVLFLKKFNIKDKAVFCSVVPSNFRIIKKVFERELRIKIIELKNIYKNKIIKLKVNKKQIGSDRLANAISVFNKKNNFRFLRVVALLSITDFAFSIDSITTAVAISDQYILIIFGAVIGVLALRFTSGIFLKLLDIFSRLETAGYVAILIVGIKLLLNTLIKESILPDYYFYILILFAFIWGFSKKESNT